MILEWRGGLALTTVCPASPEHIDWAAYETVTAARSRWLAICEDTSSAVRMAARYFRYASVSGTRILGSEALTPFPKPVATCWAWTFALRVYAMEVGTAAPAGARQQGPRCLRYGHTLGIDYRNERC